MIRASQKMPPIAAPAGCPGRPVQEGCPTEGSGRFVAGARTQAGLVPRSRKDPLYRDSCHTWRSCKKSRIGRPGALPAARSVCLCGKIAEKRRPDSGAGFACGGIDLASQDMVGTCWPMCPPGHRLRRRRRRGRPSRDRPSRRRQRHGRRSSARRKSGRGPRSPTGSKDPGAGAEGASAATVGPTGAGPVPFSGGRAPPSRPGSRR